MRFTSRNEPPPRRDAQSEKDKTRRPQRGTRKPQTNQNHPPRGQGPSGGGREGGEDRCPPEAAAKKPTTPAGHRQAEPVRQGRRPRPTERATEDDVRTHGGAPDQQKDPTHPTGNPAPAKAAGAQGAAPKARGKQARTPRGRRSGGPNTACRDGPTAATIHGLRRPGGAATHPRGKRRGRRTARGDAQNRHPPTQGEGGKGGRQPPTRITNRWMHERQSRTQCKRRPPGMGSQPPTGIPVNFLYILQLAWRHTREPQPEASDGRT